MTLATLHANHIGGVGGGFEPQRVNNALMYIAGLDGAAASATPAGQASEVPRENDLVLSLSTFPIPKRTMGIIEIGYLNEKRKFAGNPTYDDLSVVYKDYVDRKTAKLLWIWNYQVHNPETGKTGLASVYKKNGWVSLFDPSGGTERQYKLIGVWPSAFDPGDIDMTGEDSINITVTLTIDKTIPSNGLNPGGEGADQSGVGSQRRPAS